MTPPEVIFRPAEAADLDYIVKFNRAMAQETEAKPLPLDVVDAGVSALFDNPQYGFYLVAAAAGEPIGSLMVTFEWSDWRNGLIWWVQSVYVHTDWRRRGVYRGLYQQVKTLAGHNSMVRGLRLYVAKDNRVAQQTYRALGMQESNYLLFEDLLFEKMQPS